MKSAIYFLALALMLFVVQSQTTDLCADVECGEGFACDSRKGKCRGLTCETAKRPCKRRDTCVNTAIECEEGDLFCKQFVCEKPEDLCANVTCEEGSKCSRKTGECETKAPRELHKELFYDEESCANVTCEEDFECDPRRGKCVGITCETARRPCKKRGSCVDTIVECEEDDLFCPQFVCEKPENLCLNVTCEEGEKCNRRTGECGVKRGTRGLQEEQELDLCADVSCEEGFQCHPKSGTCKGVTCDTAKRSCRKKHTCVDTVIECDEDKPFCRQFVCEKPENLCADVTCEEGSKCSRKTGECIVRVESD